MFMVTKPNPQMTLPSCEEEEEGESEALEEPLEATLLELPP